MISKSEYEKLKVNYSFQKGLDPLEIDIEFETHPRYKNQACLNFVKISGASSEICQNCKLQRNTHIRGDDGIILSKGKNNLKKPKSYDQLNTVYEIDIEEQEINDILNPPQFQCGICYQEYDEVMKKQLSKCSHTFCSECFQLYIQNLVENGKVMKIQCPQSGCGNAITQNEIYYLSNLEIYQKYQKFRQTLLIALSKDKKYCPTPECDNIVNIPKQSSNQISCDKCNKDFCKQCGFSWHENKTCAQLQREVFNLDVKDLNKCPKCKTLTQKDTGCQHMTCPFCSYQWCWVCGFPYKSIFHHLQYGSLVCEMIGGVFLSKRSKAFRIFLFLFFTIFFPVLILLASYALSGVGVCMLSDKIQKKWKVRQSCKCEGNFCSKTLRCSQGCIKFMKCIGCLFQIYFLLCFLIITISLIIIGGTLLFAIAVVPLYLVYFYVMIRMQCYWDKNRLK